MVYHHNIIKIIILSEKTKYYSPPSPPLVKLNFQVEHLDKADLFVVQFTGQAPPGIHESHRPYPLLELLHGQYGQVHNQ